MINMLITILKETPTYAWILLVFLMVRGLKAKDDAPLSIQKMMIVPVVFILWGLEKLFTQFSHLSISLAVYVLFVVIGTVIGYLLYLHNRTIYMNNNIVYRSGTFLPLIIMMINFLVKYCLNVMMAIDNGLYDVLYFDVIYSMLCGLSVGLFVGGLYQAYKGKTVLSKAH